VREAAARWADRGLAVRFGVEISYEARREAEIRDHLARHPYDYAIGSVHVMSYSPYTGRRVAGWVAGKSFEEIVAPYFGEVRAAIESELFDVVGHLDYVKKYLAGHVPPSAFAAAPEVYEPVLRALVESGRASRSTRPGFARRPGDLPAAMGSGQLPRPRRDDRHGRLGCPSGRGLRLRDRPRLRDRRWGGLREVAVRRAPGAPRAGSRATIPDRIRRARPIGAP